MIFPISGTIQARAVNFLLFLMYFGSRKSRKGCEGRPCFFEDWLSECVNNEEEGWRGCGYGCQKTFGFLLSSGDWMERRGCKKVGRVQVFLDGLLEGNSWGRTAGGRQVDRKGAGSEACERETDGGEGNCRRTVLNLISAYALQAGRPRSEKEEFFTLLGKIVSEIDDGEKLLIGGDLNGHVGAGVEGFEGVHGGFGFGKRNVEGEMILEFADAWNFVVANTWFKKDEGRLITYESLGNAGL